MPKPCGEVDSWYLSEAREVLFISCGKKLIESSDAETSGLAFDLVLCKTVGLFEESIDRSVCIYELSLVCLKLALKLTSRGFFYFSLMRGR